MKKIKYLLFILISIQHIFAQVPSYVPTDGLIAYYPFNGNANDESGNGNDGLVDGATLITDRFGNDNSAYEFDGINNSITVTNQFFDNGYGSYAINLWFSCNDIDQTMQNIYNTIPHNGEGLTFNHENSPENMSHWKNSNTSGGSSWDILAANPFEYSPFLNSTAYMITVVKSESTYSYYVNGVLDKTTEINLSAQNQFTGMIFGENAYGNESFNGILDDIGIWNRALTEQEITNLYNSETNAQVPSYVPTDGLIAYYPFNGNANDESGNGNDGLVDGATLITDRFGNDNSAYEFDGINNSITVTNQFFDNGYGSYAINLWFSCNDIDQTMQNIYNTIPHNGEGLTFNHENSPENMSHWKNSNTSGGSSWDILAANPFEYSPFLNSTAYMITVVKSESTYSYYVNGVLDKTTEINLSAQNQFTGMIFGENAYGNESFNGILDDIGIWNRALTEQEITNLYNSETNAQVPSYVPTDGLIGYYPFNGNANDESGNGNDGAVDGATLITDRFGNDNSAYSFDGINDFIQAPNYSSNSSFTVSCWVNMTTYNLNSLGANDMIFVLNHSGENNLSRSFMIGYRNFGNEYGSSSYIFDNTGGVGGYISYLTNQTPPSGNIWHHFVSVFENGTYVKMYLDGELINNNTENVPTQTNMPSLPIFFGKGVATQVDYLQGELDDIGLWNRALTEQEITNLYNSETLSIDDQNLTNILIYPNPVVNKLFIQGLTGPIKVTVYNILGELVLSKTTSSEINVGNLQRGIYIVEIINEQKTTVKKFIKN